MASEVAVFGGGCFWCTEAILKQLRGVVEVTSGYAGGHTENPTYAEVSSGKAGHAEVVRIEFDPEIISYRDLLTVFFASHDPTTPNRQGPDVGSQYRSVILTTSDEQRKAAEGFIEEINTSDMEGDEIVTEVKPLDKFYEAEEEQKDFYENHPTSSYSIAMISPKLKKVRGEFKHLIEKHL